MFIDVSNVASLCLFFKFFKQHRLAALLFVSLGSFGREGVGKIPLGFSSTETHTKFPEGQALFSNALQDRVQGA